MSNLHFVVLFWISVFIFLFSSSAFSSEKSNWQWVKAEKVHEMLKEGASLWLIDLRGSMAYEAEHIEGSVNIPASMIIYKNISKTKALVLIDDSIGQKTAMDTADMLVRNGYEKIYVLEGGIISWGVEGYPIVRIDSFVRGITTEELKRALSKKALVKIFDMRDEKDAKKSKIQDSELVPGSNIEERIEKLKKLLKKESNNDIAGKLQKEQTIVLVYSASENAETHTRKVMNDIKGDVRYLIGGYETFVRGKDKQMKTIGSCPTCPGE